MTPTSLLPLLLSLSLVLGQRFPRGRYHQRPHRRQQWRQEQWRQEKEQELVQDQEVDQEDAGKEERGGRYYKPADEWRAQERASAEAEGEGAGVAIETGEAEEGDFQHVGSHPAQFGLEIEGRAYTPHSGCEIKHETVTVVKQVPSFTKHCTKVEDTKCKTVYKNAFTTEIETQCTATFDTSCDSTLETAYKQQCKTIVDVECRIVNLEDQHGGHESKKICEDVPSEKCIPVPVKVEGQKCVNVPTQMCENVPVTVAQEVPQQQCYKKPRKVCQTLVSTKPKVVTAQIPREVCGHEAKNHRAKQRSTFPPSSKPPSSFGVRPPSFRPSLSVKGAEKTRDKLHQQLGSDDYDYEDGEEVAEGDDELEDGFRYPPRGKPAALPSTEGFDKNLLQFLQQNN